MSDGYTIILTIAVLAIMLVFILGDAWARDRHMERIEAKLDAIQQEMGIGDDDALLVGPTAAGT